jgi:hypothetical protein
VTRAERREVKRVIKRALAHGWTEWDRDGRRDGVRSFDYRPSAQTWLRVHVVGGQGTVVSSPYGIDLGTYPVAEAFGRARQAARDSALVLLESGRLLAEDATDALETIALWEAAE